MINNTKSSTALSGSGTPGDVQAMLLQGAEFEGTFRFEGTARIDGKFKGEVHSKGLLVIGENAIFDGDVDVGSAIIGGRVAGDATAKTRIELLASAKFSGKIKTPVLIVQEGASFDGYCQMTKDISAEKDG